MLGGGLEKQSSNMFIVDCNTHKLSTHFNNNGFKDDKQIHQINENCLEQEIQYPTYGSLVYRYL